MDKGPRISIVIPIHDMKGGADFLWRSINALTEQTYQNFEIIITKQGKMAENTNAGIKAATGKLVKILFLDDCLSHPNVLQEIVDNFEEKDAWMILGADDNLFPYWTDDIETGNNHLGSPSALVMRNYCPKLFFDEKMSWLLDADLYKRMHKLFGPPKILNGNFVKIGKGDHQMTHILTDEEKLAEHNYMKEKHV